jgi:hypothetical protein
VKDINLFYQLNELSVVDIDLDPDPHGSAERRVHLMFKLYGTYGTSIDRIHISEYMK